VDALGGWKVYRHDGSHPLVAPRLLDRAGEDAVAGVPVIPRLRRLLLLAAFLVAALPVAGAERTITGTASWGRWPGHVVTRLPRGTSIFVEGPTGGWTGPSFGYGPDPDIFPERIVDLDREVFRWVCGDPSIGICKVRLSY
jgi:hypothetical protein